MKYPGVKIIQIVMLGLSGVMLAIAPALGQSDFCAPEIITAQFEQKLSLLPTRSPQPSDQAQAALIEKIAQCGSESAQLKWELLGRSDPLIQINATTVLRRIGSDAISAIQSALTSPNKRTRIAAAQIAAKMDFERALLESLRNRLQQETDPDVLEVVVNSIGSVGLAAKAAGTDIDGIVLDLLRLLDRQPASVRRETILTLGYLQTDAPQVVPVLVEVLQSSDDQIQSAAAQALKKFGFEAREALPDLVEALAESEGSTTVKLVEAITAIVKAYLREASSWSPSDLEQITELEAVEQNLQQAIDQLEGRFAGGTMEELRLTQNSVQTKLENLKGNPLYQSVQWVAQNPWVWFAIVIPVGYLAIFWFFPLRLLQWDEGIQLVTLSIPSQFRDPLIRILFPLKYHPHVLDAWVKTYPLLEVIQNTEESETLREKAIAVTQYLPSTSEEILQALLRILRNREESDELRQKAIEVLEYIGFADGIQLLVEVLESETESIPLRKRAIQTLVHLGWESSQFEKIVRDETWNSELRRQAASSLLIHRQESSIKLPVLIVELKGQEGVMKVKDIQILREDLGGGVFLNLAFVPAGEFMMGSSELESDSRKYERPQHRVSVKSYWMSQFPITQAQWEAVALLPKAKRELATNPSRLQSDNRPVERISWLDAVEFCDRLSQYTGKLYRLPTEAEWEYACRAGTTSSYHFGEELPKELANFAENYAGTTPVGQFGVGNEFGLYDMHGNVFEWCLEHWHENYISAPNDGSAWTTGGDSGYRIVRGGSWYVIPGYCRSAYRFRLEPDLDSYLIGFRVCCSAPRAL